MPDVLTVNGKPYSIIRLLGRGKGGYSYLTEHDGHLSVLKQIHHEPCDYYHFGNKLQSELNDYHRLKQIGIPMPDMLDVDVEQERILKTYIEGDTVFDLVKRDLLPDWCIQQMEELCRKLYAANTNIDYFPTNFIPSGGVLYYVDYECNDYMEQWDFAHWGVKYWTKTDDFLAYMQSHP